MEGMLITFGATKRKTVVCLLLLRIVTEGEKREVWRLTLENVSKVMKSEDKEREQNMYKDVSEFLSCFLCVHCQIKYSF